MDEKQFASDLIFFESFLFCNTDACDWLYFDKFPSLSEKRKPSLFMQALVRESNTIEFLSIG